MKYALSMAALLLATSQLQPATVLVSGQAIGKAHHLRIYPSSGATKVRSRVLGTEVVVSYPAVLTAADPVVQQSAEAACVTKRYQVFRV